MKLWILTLLLVLGPAVFSGEPNAVPHQDSARTHWAFIPPRDVLVPVVKQPGRAGNPIDAFLSHRLEAQGLTFSPQADKAVLLRRLSFDLTGLPPSPEEREIFLADSRPSAYEAQVDRLLASPRYGERWGQHWLDLARHADTDGFEHDDVRPEAWRFRDWVVRALNEDLPYDRFLALQMAGDELAPLDPDAAVGTGFHRAYPDMVDLNDQALRRQNALDDITETTGLVFLGLTIGCARCHDHKTDPIHQTDFYRLQAFFTPARFRDDFPLATPAERTEHAAKVTAWNDSVATLRGRIAQIEAPVRERLAPGLPPGLDDRTAGAFNWPEAERSAEDWNLIFEAFQKDQRVKVEAIAGALEPAHAKELGSARIELDRLRSAAPRPLPVARVLDEAGREAPATLVRKRGDFYSPGAEVSPACPEVFASETLTEIVPLSRSTGRRAALAAWLTRDDHPLTARVLVNRLWQHHFRRGLVATPSDFGRMGELPTHPELLDWLAKELIHQGWSLKVMHRLMVTSEAYKQSSRPDPNAAAIDPENLLNWRHSSSRLEGEAIRDAVLAASGRLNQKMGGPGIFPELPPELGKLSSRGAAWPVTPDPVERNRRSLYVFVRRNLRFPFFEAFDRPDPNDSCPQRPVTTIAPQALSLLNGGLAADAARELAERIVREAGNETQAQIERAYCLTLGRLASDEEQEIATQFLSNEVGSTLSDFMLILLNLNEFVTID